MKKFLEIIKNKWLIKGTTTILLVAIIIAVYILLNWGIKKINLEDIDCTEKKLYSLSDETKNRMKDIEKEITIQLLNMNELYKGITEYAQKYTKVNDKIKVEEIDDLSSRVDLMTKYSLQNTDSLIVIKSGDKEKTLTMNDLSTIDYTTYEQIDRTEEAITNAIIEVTLNKKPKIYIFSGSTYYNTQEALAQIVSKLKDESNEVEYLDMLSKGKVPEDCDCLVITTLSKDLTELEKDKISEYIQNGGKIMMLTSQNVLEIDTPNLDSILSQYGISIEYGAIFEQDESRMLQDAPEFVIVDAYASYMEKIDMALKLCLIDAGKINFKEQEELEKLGVEYEQIASTGEKSFVRTNFNINSAKRADSDSEEGSSIVGALVKKKISDDKTSKLIIFSNELFASNLQIPISSQYYQYAVDLRNNEDVILNSISHLTEREDTITIRKTGEIENYTVTEKENNIIKIIIFSIPAIIIIIGIVVWQIRRRKR
ncbi:MAG: GldG family protein [Clostridia bacterium]|nr:GldG family protein [Clostridia bacterium]